jgi:hypothetical protein
MGVWGLPLAHFLRATSGARGCGKGTTHPIRIGDPHPLRPDSPIPQFQSMTRPQEQAGRSRERLRNPSVVRQTARLGRSVSPRLTRQQAWIIFDITNSGSRVGDDGVWRCFVTTETPIPEALRSLGEPLRVYPPRAGAGRAGYFTIAAILAILSGLAVIGIVNRSLL